MPRMHVHEIAIADAALNIESASSTNLVREFACIG